MLLVGGAGAISLKSFLPHPGPFGSTPVARAAAGAPLPEPMTEREARRRAMTLCARVAGPNAVALAAAPLVNDPGHGRAPVTDWEVDCRADGGTYCVRLDAGHG